MSYTLHCIRSRRLFNNMSLSMLAERTGLSKGYLSELETSPAANPTLDVLLRIAQALDVSITELLVRVEFVRFRADPRKVRIGIRRLPCGWRAEIAGRFVATHKLSPVRALVRALRLAQQSGLEGIDLGMQWSYPHPWIGLDG